MCTVYNYGVLINKVANFFSIAKDHAESVKALDKLSAPH